MMTYPMVLWVRDELYPYRYSGRVVVAYEDSGVQLRYPGSTLPLINDAGAAHPFDDRPPSSTTATNLAYDRVCHGSR